MKYVLDSKAYEKVILHAFKYPSQAVTGVLLGTSNTEEKIISIVDAIPLFHGQILAPMLEIAMMQVEEYATKESLKIIGCYSAPELLTQRNLDGVTIQIADKINTYFAESCIIMVDNSKLGLPLAGTALQVYTKDGTWKISKQSLDVSGEEKMLKELNQYITQGKHHHLVDFSNHLDDITLDWCNKKLLQ